MDQFRKRPLLYCCRRAMCPIWYAPVMAAKKDNLLTRQEFILHQLQESGTISIEELCSTLGASIATIRRDLEDLESRSLLKRVRGGAVPNWTLVL